MTVLNTKRIVFTARPLRQKLATFQRDASILPDSSKTCIPAKSTRQTPPPSFKFLQIQRVICALGFRGDLCFSGVIQEFVFPTGFAGIKFTCTRRFSLHPDPTFTAAVVRSLREARKISSPSLAYRTCVHTLLTLTLGARSQLAGICIPGSWASRTRSCLVNERTKKRFARKRERERERYEKKEIVLHNRGSCHETPFST